MLRARKKKSSRDYEENWPEKNSSARANFLMLFSRGSGAGLIETYIRVQLGKKRWTLCRASSTKTSAVAERGLANWSVDLRVR